MIKSLIKITLSAFIMMVIVKIINNILGINNVFVILIIDGIVGSIIFFVGCIILKVKELNEMLDMLGNKLIRKEGS